MCTSFWWAKFGDIYHLDVLKNSLTYIEEFKLECLSQERVQSLHNDTIEKSAKILPFF